MIDKTEIVNGLMTDADISWSTRCCVMLAEADIDEEDTEPLHRVRAYRPDERDAFCATLTCTTLTCTALWVLTMGKGWMIRRMYVGGEAMCYQRLMSRSTCLYSG
jgi:hypothetical protein